MAGKGFSFNTNRTNCQFRLLKIPLTDNFIHLFPSSSFFYRQLIYLIAEIASVSNQSKRLMLGGTVSIGKKPVVPMPVFKKAKNYLPEA